jgi:hypothetical protein
VTGPEAAPIIDLLDPSIAGLSAMDEEFLKPFKQRDFLRPLTAD